MPGLRKSVLVNHACVGKGSRCAVGIIGRTKLPIHRARSAASNAVAAARPRSPNGIARRYVERVWHKREALSDRHIDSLAVNLMARRWELAVRFGRQS